MREKIYQLNVTIDAETMSKLKRTKERIGISYSKQIAMAVGAMFKDFYSLGMFYSKDDHINLPKPKFDLIMNDEPKDPEALECELSDILEGVK